MNEIEFEIIREDITVHSDRMLSLETLENLRFDPKIEVVIDIDKSIYE